MDRYVNWLMLGGVVVILGILFGLSVYTFRYAEGTSYFSDNPNACVDCHVMREQFDGWNRSSHKAVATCNDRDTPHSFPEKWVVKGVNGWNHSWAFTTGNFPNNIRIKGFNARIVGENCADCHQTMVSNIHSTGESQQLSCVARQSELQANQLVKVQGPPLEGQ